mmetsp:Transcript_65627/g.125156  ORF Transcript_65627/g.125156 Transcript_65627/m.125156 type:complete len:193 (+) Transcript_65627:56-634(+)
MHDSARSMSSCVVAVFFVSAALLVFARKKHDVKSQLQGSESLMSRKTHGTCPKAAPSRLRWNCDQDTADRICCYNRHYAEHSGYWLGTNFLQELEASKPKEITFYDTITQKPLFVAPRGRTWKEFVAESKAHGWPSFRDAEVVEANVRVLKNGEAVSTDGTHLGHNLPDRKGNRYCINLVSVAGVPAEDGEF